MLTLPYADTKPAMTMLVQRLRAACEIVQRDQAIDFLLQRELSEIVEQFEQLPVYTEARENAIEQCLRKLRWRLGLRTPRSAWMLLHLAVRPGMLHLRGDLAHLVGSPEKVLSVYAHEIRKGFRAIGMDDPIEAIWGKGYVFQESAASFLSGLIGTPLPDPFAEGSRNVAATAPHFQPK